MITLQKLRVYRDHAEVLLQVKLTDEVEVSPSTRVYAVPLGKLTSTERDSLHILSPQQRLLHIAWQDSELSDLDDGQKGKRSPLRVSKEDDLDSVTGSSWGSLIEILRKCPHIGHTLYKV